MKAIFTTTLILIIGTLLSAQVEISIGPGYSQQAFYSLETQETFHLDNDAWDLAFSNIGRADAGIFINEFASYGGTPLELYNTGVSDWNQDLSSDTSLYNEDRRIYNDEISWNDGAFNSVKDITDPFDYGWGVYNPSNHVVEGSNVFILKLRDGSYKKIFVSKYTQNTYHFSIADLDGQNEEQFEVSKTADSSYPVLFSYATKTTVPVPADYDLIFCRYTTELDAGGGDLVQYTVSGILIAPGVEAVVARDIDPVTIDEADYKDDYTSKVSVIGHDWKRYDFTSGWEIDPTRVQFIKTKGKIYKLQFIDFEGSSTGVATIIQEFLGNSTSITQNISQNDVRIYPNPATDMIFVESYDEQADISIYDSQGRLLMKHMNYDLSQGINVSTLPENSLYFAVLSQDNKEISNFKFSK